MKKYYQIIVEGNVPVKVYYKVFADSPEEALKMVEKNVTKNIFSHNILLPALKKLSARVYKFGSLVVEKFQRY